MLDESIETELKQIEKKLFLGKEVIDIKHGEDNYDSDNNMNLILNLTWIKTHKEALVFNLKTDSQTILEVVISQYKLPKRGVVYILINSNFKQYINSIIQSSNLENKIELIAIDNLYEAELCSNIEMLKYADSKEKINKIVNYPNFKMKNEEKFGFIYTDGTKIYTKKSYSFYACNMDAIVLFENEYNVNEPVSLFITASTRNCQPGKIKRVIVNDYQFNLIELKNIKSLMTSSLKTDSSKEVAILSVNKLFEEFKFDAGLKIIKQMAKKDKYWRLLYIDTLAGFGYDTLLINFFNENKNQLINSIYPQTQQSLFSNELKIISTLIEEERLFLTEIEEFINGEVDIMFSFLIQMISKFKFKFLNYSKLNQLLISSNKLDEEMATILIDEMIKCNPNPYVLKKNIVDIFDYLVVQKNLQHISNTFLSKITIALRMNEELFSNGIDKRIKLINYNINLTTKINIKEPVAGDGNRVAICITGLAKKNYEKNLDILKYFIGDDLNADYFVQTWDKIELYTGVASVNESNDYKWSIEYLSKINKLLPNFISRKANFEALFPNTAELLFTKQFSAINADTFVEVLGEDVKVIKKYSLDSFKEKYLGDLKSSLYEQDHIIRMCERGFVQKSLDEYANDNNIKYDYIISIDINTALKSKITLESLMSISKDEVYMVDNKQIFDDSLVVGRYSEVKAINDYWTLCQLNGSLMPYRINQQALDYKKINPIFIHAVSCGFNVRATGDKFGSTYISKKIQVPNFDEQLTLDLSKIDEQNEKYNTYFDALKVNFTTPIKNSTNYKLIKKVDLERVNIVEDGILLQVSIKGTDLKQIVKTNLHIHAKADVGLNSNCCSYKTIRRQLEILKYENDEIVAKVVISDRDLVHGKTWYPSLLLNEYTPMTVALSLDKIYKSYEYTKYGLKFVSNEDELKIGINTKEFVLNGVLE